MGRRGETLRGERTEGAGASGGVFVGRGTRTQGQFTDPLSSSSLFPYNDIHSPSREFCHSRRAGVGLCVQRGGEAEPGGGGGVGEEVTFGTSPPRVLPRTHRNSVISRRCHHGAECRVRVAFGFAVAFPVGAGVSFLQREDRGKREGGESQGAGGGRPYPAGED